MAEVIKGDRALVFEDVPDGTLIRERTYPGGKPVGATFLRNTHRGRLPEPQARDCTARNLRDRITRLEGERQAYERSGDSASEAECYVELRSLRRQLAKGAR
ncbi:MAG: hypothetical protein AAFY15_08815 [Cyanobacteria bacterium J06648_11]